MKENGTNGINSTRTRDRINRRGGKKTEAKERKQNNKKSIGKRRKGEKKGRGGGNGVHAQPQAAFPPLYPPWPLSALEYVPIYSLAYLYPSVPIPVHSRSSSAGTPEGFGVGSPDGESGSFGRGRSGRSTPLSSSAPTGAATGGIGPGGSRRDSNSSCGSGGRSGTGGGGGGGSGRLAGGAVVMARLALAWRKDVRLDYCITFKLQVTYFFSW